MVNNGTTTANSYFMEYIADSQTDDVDLTKADGYWAEVARPNQRYRPNEDTLPHDYGSAGSYFY